MEENADHCHGESSSNNSSHLEYLDEFLQLKCAPDLIEMGLFPNAKEITESFSMWRALKEHIFPHLSKRSENCRENRCDAIIVVGDGMTPRTGALCAYLTKGSWLSISIDPIIQYDSYLDRTFLNRRSLTRNDHCEQWKSIKRLRIVRDKIERVSIECRRCIIVLMHAHVKIEDVINAIDATEGIVGVVTCPCCKWRSFQEICFEQTPHLQYTDQRLLSVKNQINLWSFPKGILNQRSSSSINSINEDHKWGLDKNTIENLLSNRDQVKQRAIDLWPQIFSQGIKAFNINDTDQSQGTNEQIYSLRN